MSGAGKAEANLSSSNTETNVPAGNSAADRDNNTASDNTGANITDVYNTSSDTNGHRKLANNDIYLMMCFLLKHMTTPR